jgi:hypothetical protein
MKKLLLSAAFLLGLGQLPAAHAQVGGLVNLIGAGIGFGVQKAMQPKLTPEQKAAQQQAAAKALADRQAAELAATGPAIPKELTMYRTPADKLPKQAAEQITGLEAQLDRCHAAMLASPTGPVCSPEQRAAIQSAAVSVARAKPSFDLHPYQQEMAYYMAEDDRRQQPAAAPAPAK